MNYTENDYELVYMVSENNEDALKLLLDKYDKLIKIYAYYYNNKYKKYNIAIEELIQEGKLGLYIASCKFIEAKDVKFYTFALVCIKRYILSYISYFTRDKNLIIENSIPFDENFHNIIDYDINPSNIIESFEYQKFIINFKNSLSFLDSNIFELRYNYFSYKDIAKLLDIEEKKVDNSLIKIKDKLKKYMLKNDYVL